MQLYSTKYHNVKNSIKKFDANVLMAELKYATNITIISAYYSTEFLKKIICGVLKKNRRNCNVLLVLNGLGGQRLIDQKRELKELKSHLLINEKFNLADIRLNFDSNIMHTKLYYIERAHNSIWFIGSANSTGAAFNNHTDSKNNEELMIGSSLGKRAVTSYISNLKNKSIEIESGDYDWPAINNLISFFRSGTLFFKSNINLSFTFSKLNIPEEIEDKLIRIEQRPIYTNPGNAWGPYNLLRALDITDESDTRDANRASIKPYSIETCFGLWVPNSYVSDFQEGIRRSSSKLRKKFTDLKRKMEEYEDQKILDGFDQYLGDVRKRLEDAEISNKDFNFDEEIIREGFKSFLRRLREKIEDKRFLNKLTNKFVSAGMPEIWEDAVSMREFEESFFDYVSSNYNHHGNTPIIVTSIINSIGINGAGDYSFLDGDAVKIALQHFLNKKTWNDKNWINPRAKKRHPFFMARKAATKG